MKRSKRRRAFKDVLPRFELTLLDRETRTRYRFGGETLKITQTNLISEIFRDPMPAELVAGPRRVSITINE